MCPTIFSHIRHRTEMNRVNADSDDNGKLVEQYRVGIFIL